MFPPLSSLIIRLYNYRNFFKNSLVRYRETPPFRAWSLQTVRESIFLWRFRESVIIKSVALRLPATVDPKSDGRKTMKHPFIFIPVLFVLAFCVPCVLSEEAPKTEELKIMSPVFENNGSLPLRYTCDGKNINPPLMIENVPRGSKSLALVLDDLDAPRGTFVHWIVWNMDPGIKDIRENSVPHGAVEGTNGFKKRKYGGPCPPTRAHRYVFRLYALNNRLTLDPHSIKADLDKAMKGHILAQAQLVTSYKRK